LTSLKTSLNISASPKDVKYAIKATEDLIVEIKSLFGDRIKAFDEKEISALQQITDNANKHGVILSFTELMVAATALAHNLKVATKNTHLFKAAGLQVINPRGE
jgi:predicted nucleic acid-binding protein